MNTSSEQNNQENENLSDNTVSEGITDHNNNSVQEKLPHSPEQLKEILTKNNKAFLKFNRDRLDALYRALPDTDRETFSLIPILLHFDQVGLPGFIKDAKTPHGLMHFEFRNKHKALIKHCFPDVQMKRKGLLRKPIIKSLLTIGSLGTIGHTGKSDVDYWVCIDKTELTKKEITCLQEKLTIIEEWSWNERNFEVHFFITDLTEAQTDNYGSSDEESCGSAQAKLLKDEFYRTTIVITGQIPFWWITPVESSQDDYSNLILLNKKYNWISHELLIDLGFIDEISKAEFFGAALWQMNKSLKSPFKSLLKMAILARYIDDETQSSLLCIDLKSLVLNRTSSKELIDPYVLMFDKISEYYALKKEWDSFELLQKSFYLKVGLKLSTESKNSQSFSDKFRVMKSYIAKWGWGTNIIEELDNLEKWHPEKIRDFGYRIRDFLLTTYKDMVIRARVFMDEQTISQEDLTLLGQKLNSVLGEKPGKVEHFFTYFFTGSMKEDRLFLIENTDSIKKWRLFKEPPDTNSSEMEGGSIYECESLIHLAIWSIHNEIYGQSTTLSLISENASMTVQDLKRLFSRLDKRFSHIDPFTVSSEVFKKKPHNEDVFISVEVSKKMSKLISSNDQMLIAEDWNVFYHGKDKHCLLDKVNIFLKNNWGELFHFKFDGEQAIIKTVKFIFDNLPNNFKWKIDEIEIWAPHGRWHQAVRSRFTLLFDEIMTFFNPQKINAEHKYFFIFRLSNSYYIIIRSNNRISIQGAPNHEKLFNLLGVTDNKFIECRTDSSLEELSHMNLMYKLNRPDTIQVAIYRSEKKIFIIILDELGCLFVDDLTNIKINKYLIDLGHFIDRYLHLKLINNPQERKFIQLNYCEIKSSFSYSHAPEFSDLTTEIKQLVRSENKVENPIKILGHTNPNGMGSISFKIGREMVKGSYKQSILLQNVLRTYLMRYRKIPPGGIYISEAQIDFHDNLSGNILKGSLVPIYKLKREIEKRLRFELISMFKKSKST